MFSLPPSPPVWGSKFDLKRGREEGWGFKRAQVIVPSVQ